MYPSQFVQELKRKIEKVEQALRVTRPGQVELMAIFERTLAILRQVKANHEELDRLIGNNDSLN